MPQLLFIDAPTTLKANSHIHKIHRKTSRKINDRFEELKGKGINALITRGYYLSNPYGKEAWCEDVDENSPEMSDTDKELFLLGQWMGLDNWIEYEHSNNELTQWLASPERLLGNSITPVFDKNGEIERIEGHKGSIGFDLDRKGRAMVTTRYDRRGKELRQLLRWKYHDDSKVESFELFAENANKVDKNTNSMVWTPQYSKNRISSLVGEGDFEDRRRNRNGTIHYSIDVTYSYNDIGQITHAILDIYSYTTNSEDTLTSEGSVATFTTDYSYKEDSTYWDSATMRKGTGSISDDDLNPSKIRYVREFIDN
jgi:hypothetical protein